MSEKPNEGGNEATYVPTTKPTSFRVAKGSSSSVLPYLPPLDLGNSLRSGLSSRSDRYRGDSQLQEQAEDQKEATPVLTPASDRTVINQGNTEEKLDENDQQEDQQDQQHQRQLTELQIQSLNRLDDITEGPPSRRSDRSRRRTVTTVTTTSTVKKVYTDRDDDDGTENDNDDDDDDDDEEDDKRDIVNKRRASTKRTHSQRSPNKLGLRNRNWGLSFCTTPRKIRPKPSVMVWIKYKIFNVLWVDTVSQSFRTRFSLEATWEDPSLNGCSPDSTRVQNAWHPRRLSLVNEIESEYAPNFELCSWELNPSQHAVMTCYFNCSASFITKMDLRMFPFDSQDLKITFTMHSRDRDVEFALNPFRASGFDEQNFMLHEWTPLYTHSSFEFKADRNEPVFHIQCRLRRQSGFYLTNVALPVFLITVLTWLGYAIPAGNTGSRLEAILTLVLTSVAFKFVVAGHLPPLSYNTLCDYYVLWSLLFQVAVAVQIGLTPMIIAPANNHNITLTATSVANANQDYLARLEALDRIFASLSFGLYVLMHVIFVVVIKLHRKRQREAFPGADTWQKGGREALGLSQTLAQVMPTNQPS